jgi:hypothetical protein
MMPVFPLPPLKFRTAGFPRYGFKAGMSDAAFPAQLVCHRPSYSLLPPMLPALCPGRCACEHLRANGFPLYPRGPRSGPGYAVPVHQHLTDPIRPTRKHIQISPHCGLYQMPSLCMLPCLGSPRVVLCFRLVLLLDMSPTSATESSSAAFTQFFADNISLRPGLAARHSLFSPTLRFSWGMIFRGRLRFAFAATCRFAGSPVGADRNCFQPTGTFTSGLPMKRVTLFHCRISLRWQLSNSIGRTFTCWTTN